MSGVTGFLGRPSPAPCRSAIRGHSARQRPRGSIEQRGWLARMFDDEEIERARQQPPTTCAYFRGECVRRYPESIAAASWDSVVFDIPQRESSARAYVGTHAWHARTRLAHPGASPDAASIDALTDD